MLGATRRGAPSHGLVHFGAHHVEAAEETLKRIISNHTPDTANRKRPK
jgi:hypothetical protein